MRIKVRTQDVRLFLPLPVSMIGFALRLLPASVFEEMRTNMPEPYSGLVTRESISMIVKECIDITRENRGLEVIHVEAKDGTFVSIRL